MKTNKNLLKTVLATLILGLGSQLMAMEGKRQRDESSEEEERALQPGETTAKKGKVGAEEELAPQAMEIEENEAAWRNLQGNRDLILQSSDGHDFKMPAHTAQLSETIRSLIEDAGTNTPIPLPTIDSKTLAIIVSLLPDLEWLMAKSGRLPKGTWHESLPYNQQDEFLYIPRAFQPIVNNHLQDASTEQVENLFKAANYLDIPFLLNGAAAVLADRLIKRSNPRELLFINKDESLNLRLKNIKILATKDAPNAEREAAKRYFKENEKDFITLIPRDLLQYIMPHLVHRQCGITQEYSIADYIREHGQPELLENDTYFNGEVVLSFEAKNLTSLFGIQLLKSEIRKNTIILNLSINCLCGLSHELQGTGRPFDGFANLTILDLSHNQLTHLDPQLFAGLLNLRGLYLSDNQLTHLDPQLFAGLPNLTRLDLSHNQLTHLDPQALAGLPNLTELYLSNNQLTHLDPQLFSGLPNLRFLYLSNNQLTQDQKHRLQKELKRIRSLEL